MALTSGAKKFSVLVVVAAIIGAVVFYVSTHKKPAPVVNVEQPAVVAPQPAPAKIEASAPLAKVEEKKEAVATVTHKKKASHKKSSVSHGGSSSITKSESADERALKELAGDKL